MISLCTAWSMVYKEDIIPTIVMLDCSPTKHHIFSVQYFSLLVSSPTSEFFFKKEADFRLMQHTFFPVVQRSNFLQPDSHWLQWSSELGTFFCLNYFCTFETPCQCWPYYVVWVKAGADGNFWQSVVRLILIKGTQCLVPPLCVFCPGSLSLTARKVCYLFRRWRMRVLSVSLNLPGSGHIGWTRMVWYLLIAAQAL